MRNIVYIPAYNAGRFIASSIKSAQLAANVDEIVILANCCTDNTVEIAESFAVSDTRVVVSNSTVFMSMFDNFNRVVEGNPDEMVCVLPADDILLRAPAIELSISNDVIFFQSFRNDGVMQGWPLLLSHDLGRSISMLLEMGYNPFPFPGAVWIRRGWLQRVGGFDKRFGKSSDVELFSRLLQGRTFVSKNLGCVVRRHKFQASNVKNGVMEAREYIRLSENTGIHVDHSMIIRWISVQQKKSKYVLKMLPYPRWFALRLFGALIGKVYRLTNWSTVSGAYKLIDGSANH